MMLNPLELQTNYRDYWPQFDPNTLAIMDAITRAGCYVPRFFVAPSGGNLVQNAQLPGTYVNYVLEVPVGSWIWGCYNSSDQQFAVQVTDMGLSYKWFNTPTPMKVLLADPGSPYLFPALYPVTSPGTFLFEFFSTVPLSGGAPNSLLSLTLGVAVPLEALIQ
jgi:hypothetical protein